MTTLTRGNKRNQTMKVQIHDLEEEDEDEFDSAEEQEAAVAEDSSEKSAPFKIVREDTRSLKGFALPEVQRQNTILAN